ncbi:bifunctional PIG-L family deacetylase/class I SAM-dependent methyltransferase [Nocardioides currus]|uniref:bifunctional PIG-L family deacetylase/class I SAM-dependent methyltransferase n=1 Tax=Nocardioides currus TaxID=2133958 RepID=UPI0014031A2E|nr:bifunctional PIG-L family deacetylase/class I SAM-dependent methyltransferase [Nocardioides currus]
MVTAPAFRHDRPGTPEEAWSRSLADRDVPPLRLPATARRLLVLGAHPDDEALGASGLMRSASLAGWEVGVLCATSGEGSHPDSVTLSPAGLATVRRLELSASVAVAAPAATTACLGLPDGDVASHVDELVDHVVAAIGTQGSEVVLCAPWRSDGHPDHEAVGRAAAIAAGRTDAHLLEYPIWLWHWGHDADLPWDDVRRLPLDEDARATKRAAIAAHATQIAPISPAPGDEVLLTAEVLAHFDRADELFVETTGRVPDDALERVHRDDPDPWEVDSFYERRKRAVTLAALPRESYGRALEVGCSVGALAVDLATRSERLLAVDASEAAVAAARHRVAGLRDVEVRRIDVRTEWPDGAFDLVSISEVGYFLSPRALGELVERSLASLTRDGHLLLCHWRHQPVGWPLAGPAVHAAFLATGAPVLVAHDEPDFLLHVLGRPA